MTNSWLKGPAYSFHIPSVRQTTPFDATFCVVTSMNSLRFNATLKEWHKTNKITIPKRINVFFRSVFVLFVEFVCLFVSATLVINEFDVLIDFFLSLNSL